MVAIAQNAAAVEDVTAAVGVATTDGVVVGVGATFALVFWA